MTKGRCLWLLLLAFTLSGCVATCKVWSIGAREQYGMLDYHAPASGELDIADKPVAYSGMGNPCFIGHRPTPGEGTPVGRFAYRRDDTGGALVALPQGERSFESSGNVLVHPYHRWYGYPAQLLQVLALPADVVLATGMLLVLPFELVSESDQKSAAAERK